LACSGKYEEIILGLMMRAADDPGRPQWKPNNFFRRFAPTACGLY
jgi:hypothetical protein